MALTEVLPIIAVIGFVLFLVATAAGRPSLPFPRWWLPAALSAAFLAWSVLTIITEGPTGFWDNHTQDMWGNQVWFDLLLAASIGWWFILPRARAAGMTIWVWLILIICTGCVGFLAMVARLLYLTDRGTRA